MISKINNKEIKILYEDANINLPEEILNKIKENWKKIEQEKSNVWNGKVTCISEFIENDTKIEIRCKNSDYAHYLYDERIGLPQEYRCTNLSAGCILKTLDNYLIVGELDELTSYPTMLQIPGGNVDKNDIDGNNVNIIKTINRETLEEVNIDLENKELVSNYKISYIYKPDVGESQGVQILAVANLNMTKEEMEKYYKEYYKYLSDNVLEKEFKTIHFLNSVEQLEKMSNPKRPYLLPLIKSVIEDGCC